MGALAFVLALVAGGLLVGALARLAVPGPDPMPLWATAVLGVIGSVLGGLATWAIAGRPVGSILGAVVASALLLIAYRRFVQKRGITGPEAKRPPTRGWWLPRPRVTRPPSPEKLDRLLRAGVITQDEYDARRANARDRT
jgi:uncharacterized membrane protein YeaQ/YmgE (transglycosylase-associated protein family)